MKLKFQSPNRQMQRNALLVCFWRGCLIDWLIEAKVASYPRVSVDHYTRRLKRKGTLWHFLVNLSEQVLSCWVVMIIPIPLPQHQHTFKRRLWQKVCWSWGRGIGIGKYEIFKIRVALDFKSTPLKTFLKNLDLPQSYDCFRNTKKGVLCTAKTPPSPSRHEFLLALWNFPCLCCWRLISVLLRTLFFEFFFFFFFDRTLAFGLCQLQCTAALSALKPELKKTHVDDWCAAQTDSHNACDISSVPLSSVGLERRISGKAPRHRGWIYTRNYSQTRSTGSERPTPMHLGPTKTATHLARFRRVQSAYSSALSALKKCLVANLSAKRQLSVAKLSAKRNVSLAKREFLVANGRMAANFSSPALYSYQRDI